MVVEWLVYLIAWSAVDITVWEGLGSKALWEECVMRGVMGGGI